MKILIYLENLHRGGVDTFIINLINYWPEKKDKFIILANQNHPAIDFFKINIEKKNQVISFNVPLYNELIKKFPNLNLEVRHSVACGGPLLLFTHPHCCLLLMFNSNNKNSR